MIAIHKKYIVDAQGHPTDVIINYQEFREIEELLGLDLDDRAKEDLRLAREAREAGTRDDYVSLDEL